MLLSLVALAFSAIHIFSPHSVPKAQPLPPQLSIQNDTTPVRLKIPAIHVDAAIENVGLTADGAMGAPSGPDTTGWYMLGPRPGETGNAVIDGHSGWKDGIPAVFDSLYKVTAGDKIYVRDKNGETAAFVVRKIRKYQQHDATSAVFTSNDGKAHLNLITCAGTWSVATKSSSARIVIFADQ